MNKIQVIHGVIFLAVQLTIYNHMQITPAEVTDTMIVKEGDTVRITSDQLQDEGQNVNLSGSSVYLLIHNPQDDSTVTRTGSITSAISGSVQYQLTSGDIGTAGNRLAEWKVVNASGKVLYLPTDGYVYWNIMRNLE